MNRLQALERRGLSARLESTKRSSFVRRLASFGMCCLFLACLATTCQPQLPFERPSIVPASGPISGGTEVTIIGRNFSATSAVLFGDQAASSLTIVNDEVIRATTPPHPAGAVDIVILGPPNSVQLFAQAFTFEEPGVVTSPVPLIISVTSP
ncbi:MAG: IPT/TIG domain-containing protein, partial [Planctomycetota bacterium]|nr:IPT/TIG domain-containing protein [Planctomycetota bacterium]